VDVACRRGGRHVHASAVGMNAVAAVA
jgi:hypothetical protein